MKFTKIAVMAAIAFAYGNAYAFHSGGVAECNGCHSMHGSYEGATNVTGQTLPGASGPYLLKASDQSGACLNCHASDDVTGSSYHIMDLSAGPGVAPAELTPGGDFAYLTKTYNWSPRNGVLEESRGERHGHNVIASDFGLTVDPQLARAPGNAPGAGYPAANLACSSCHDPHGKFRRLADGSIVNGQGTSLPIRNSGSYHSSLDPVAGVYAVGAYRILGGIGYSPKSTPGYAFSATVPAAVAPSSYNRTEAVSQTRVAYGADMSEWCGNCHGGFHRPSYTSGTAGLTHPAGNDAKLPAAIIANYNAYVKTGDLSGVAASSYNTIVPFEVGSTDYAALKLIATPGNPAGTVGATATSNVSCLSCHRAHASPFDSMLRWSLAYEFTTMGDAAGVASYGDSAGPAGQGQAVAQGKTTAEAEMAYYGRPATKFAPYQRALCNKCHVKD